MKFFIDKDTTIYLNQLLKAAGVIEDYRDIRHIINRGFVSVNEKNTFQQRKIIKAGDVVKFKKHHIKVLEHEPLKEKNDDLYSTPGIRHGKVNIWKTKPLKIEIELDKEIKMISQKIHEKLLSSNSTLSLAESCTGGKIQEIITSHSRCSKYFIGGVVSYANKAKINILKVDKKTLEKYGAVSKETAIEMVKGVQQLLGTNYAGAITGRAGPQVGTEEKPTGIVHIAIYTKEKIIHNEYHFSGDRETIRKKSALSFFKLLSESI